MNASFDDDELEFTAVDVEPNKQSSDPPARTRQEHHERERAEHAYYSHIHDEVTVYDAFPATIQKLDEDENLPENTTAQDDQEDETEQSLSETLQTRRQISRIYENMGNPSYRTLT